MYYFTIVSVVFATHACFVEGQSPCKSPDGVSGTCKSVYECKSLLAIVKKDNRTPTELEFLKKSQCGFQGTTPTVCCTAPDVTAPESDKAAQNDCFTPDGDSGKCIDIHQCIHIVDMLKPPVTQEIMTFIQNSRCSGPAQYNVCCGPVPCSKKRVQGGGTCETTVSACPPDPSTECCGVDTFTYGNKLAGLGGNATNIDQYPWVVLIDYYKNGLEKHLCGGVLISGRYVLTAAHCVIGNVLNHGTPRIIRLGEFDITHDGPDCVATESGLLDCTDDVLKIPIESITTHPEYEPENPSHRHDIALIRLKEMAPFTDFIRPICLPQIDFTQSPPSYTTMFMAGWGANETHSSTNVKVHVELPFVNAEQCQVAYDAPGRKLKLSNTQLCAGGVKGKDACKGDSGGPLMVETGRIYEVIGLVSFGPIACGTENVPGIYTKVFDYNDWILSNIKP